MKEVDLNVTHLESKVKQLVELHKSSIDHATGLSEKVSELEVQLLSAQTEKESLITEVNELRGSRGKASLTHADLIRKIDEALREVDSCIGLVEAKLGN